MTDIEPGGRYAVMVGEWVVQATVLKVCEDVLTVRVDDAVEPWATRLEIDPSAVIRPWDEYCEIRRVQRRAERKWQDRKDEQVLECEKRMVDLARRLAQCGAQPLADELVRRLRDGTLVSDGLQVSVGTLEQIVGASHQSVASTA